MTINRAKAMSISPSPNHAPKPGPKPGSWRLALALGIFAVALSLAHHLPLAGQAFDSGWESTMATSFEYRFARYWMVHGFIATKGRPVQEKLPTVVPSFEVYGNHPPLAHWLCYLGVKIGGLGSFGLRLLPIIATTLTTMLLAIFATRKLGAWGGIAATLCFLSLPMTFLFGRMACYEAFVICCGSVAALSFLEWQGRRGLLAATLMFFITALIDWPAFFIVVVLVALNMTKGKKKREGSLRILASVATGFTCYFILLTYWNGSIAEAWTCLRSAAGLGNAYHKKETGLRFVTNQLQFNIGLLGWSGMMILAFGIPISLWRVFSRKASSLVMFALLWVTVGIINVAAFPNRAFDHDFWVYLCLPGYCYFLRGLLRPYRC